MIFAMKKIFSIIGCFFILFLGLQSCKQKKSGPSRETITSLQLKSGKIISCGATDKQFGSVEFQTSCGKEVQEDFNLAVELLHSFEYDEAEKAFAKVIEKEPGCAMAYWGVAMSNF